MYAVYILYKVYNMYTKQLFEQVARIIQDIPDPKSKDECFKQFVQLFASNNERFDPERFAKACKL